MTKKKSETRQTAPQEPLLVEIENETPLSDELAEKIALEALKSAENPTEEAPEQPAGQEQPYTISSWKGITKYDCNHCPFDSLELEVIRDHVYGRHIRPQALREARAATGLIVADERGRIK